MKKNDLICCQTHHLFSMANLQFNNNDLLQFKQLALFAVSIRYPNEVVTEDFIHFERVAKMMGDYIGKTIYNQIYHVKLPKKPSIEKIAFQNFCEDFNRALTEIKLAKHKRKKSKHRRIYIEWKRRLEKRFVYRQLKIEDADQAVSPINESDVNISDAIVNSNSKPKKETFYSDSAEVKSMIELFFINLQQKEYKKAFERLSPEFKKYISYSKYIELFEPIFNPETKNHHVFNVTPNKINEIHCEAFFEQAVSNCETYSIFLNILDRNSLNKEDAASKEHFDRLMLHLQELSYQFNLAFETNPESDVIKKINDYIATLGDKTEIIDISIREIFLAATIDRSNIEEMLPLTRNCFVKIDATFECKCYKNRWFIELFTMTYAGSDLSNYTFPIILGKPEVLQLLNSQENESKE